MIEQTFLDLIKDFQDPILQFGRDVLRENDKNASGRTSNQLTTTVVSGSSFVSLQLLGPDHVFFTLNGRGPGKAPPPGIIEKWLDDRMLDFNAYLVGQAIANDGTKAKYFGFNEQMDEKVQAFLNPRIDNEKFLTLLLTDFTNSLRLP